LSLPKVRIGGYGVTRLVLGSNPFLGFSHFSQARSRWLRGYFTVDRVVEVMRRCQELGVNAVVGPADEKLFQALEEAGKASGERMTWISTTYGKPDPGQQSREIRWLAGRGAEICLIHAGYTDTHHVQAENRVVGLEELLKLVRDLGMVPGVSTHNPQTVRTCERAGYDTEAYILPINTTGYLCPTEPSQVSRLIRGVEKTFVAIKPLASGRITPYEGLSYAYAAVKDRDTVALGISSVEEAEEDISLVKGLLKATREPREE